jgi:phosphoglycerate-specific signal transduction histidine kinase
MTRTVRTTLAAVLATTTLFVVGCNNKVAECNKLIEVANTEGGKVGDPGADANAMKKMADEANGVAKRIGEVDVKMPELVKFRDEMKKQYTDLAAAATKAGDAAAKNDLTKAQEALKEFTATSAANAKLVGDINKFCSE